MTDAQKDPHVLISARIGASQKMLALPSHRARWGWIVMLGQAKLQRPPGLFASLAQLRFLAGEFRDCVTPWLDAKLIHAAPNLCERCATSYGTLEGGEVVVHDFIAHQERRSRTTVWRRDNGVPNGHTNLDGNHPGNDGETVGETNSLARTGARADAGALQSQSQSPSQSDSLEGVQGEPKDPAVVYANLAGWPSQGAIDWIDQLTETYGADAVIRAIGQARAPRGKLIGAVQDVLRAEARELGKREREAEAAKVSARRLDGMHSRRLEWFRNTGKWDPAWGDAPGDAA